MFARNLRISHKIKIVFCIQVAKVMYEQMCKISKATDHRSLARLCTVLLKIEANHFSDLRPIWVCMWASDKFSTFNPA